MREANGAGEEGEEKEGGKKKTEVMRRKVN